MADYDATIIGDDPIAYWRLGETSGNTAFDERANSHDGTYVNDPTLGVEAVILATAANVANLHSIRFNDTGSRVYVLGNDDNRLYEHVLTGTFDITEVTFEACSQIITTGSDLTEFDFNEDGSELYLVARDDAAIYQYSMSNTFSIAALSYDNVSFGVSNQELTPTGIGVNDLFYGVGILRAFWVHIVGTSNNTVYQYTLPTEEQNVPVGNIDLGNTFQEWVTMTNQMLEDGQDASNVATNTMVSQKVVMQHLSREFYGLAANQSPNFGGVEITKENWQFLSLIDEPISFGSNVKTGEVNFEGNVAVSTDNVPRYDIPYRLMVGPNNGVFFRGGQSDQLLVSYNPLELRIANSQGSVQILLSSSNNFVQGRLGIRTTDPQYTLHVNGTVYANNVVDHGANVYTNAMTFTADDVNLGNVLNEEQVPFDGGTFTGNVNFERSSIVEGRVFLHGRELVLAAGNTRLEFA